MQSRYPPHVRTQLCDLGERLMELQDTAMQLDMEGNLTENLKALAEQQRQAILQRAQALTEPYGGLHVE